MSSENNWSSLNSLNKNSKISLFWPNKPSKFSYVNLQVTPKINNVNILKNKKKLNNIFFREKIKPKIIKIESGLDPKKFFNGKRVFIATGHSFDELKDINTVYKHFESLNINISVRIHPHFLKANIKKISRKFPKLIESHFACKSTEKELIESDIVIATLDSISYMAIRNDKTLVRQTDLVRKLLFYFDK